MSVKCGCGNNAEYAVYIPAQPHCLLCMLEAVDNAIAVPVRTLDPWEKEPVQAPQPKYLFNRRNVKC